MSARLSPGDRAPAFVLPDADGREVALDDLLARGRLVLYAYPAAGTPGCTKQACDFRDDLAQFEGAGLHVAGLSPDPVATLARFRDAEGLTFPLLSDADKAVLTAYGAHGEKKLYGKVVVGVIRSTFVIAPDGTVEVAQYGVRATGHVAKLRRDLGL